MTPSEIIARIREGRGQFVLVDGQWTLRNARQLPPDLLEEFCSQSEAVKAELNRRRAGPPPQQSGLSIPDNRLPRLSVADGFWLTHDARFDAVLREFGVVIGRPVRAMRRTA